MDAIGKFPFPIAFRFDFFDMAGGEPEKASPRAAGLRLGYGLTCNRYIITDNPI